MVSPCEHAHSNELILFCHADFYSYHIPFPSPLASVYYFNVCAPVTTSHGCTTAVGAAVLSVPSASVCRSLASPAATPTAALLSGDATGAAGLSLTYSQTGEPCVLAGGFTPYSLVMNLACDSTGSSSTLSRLSVTSLNCVVTISATSGAACANRSAPPGTGAGAGAAGSLSGGSIAGISAGVLAACALVAFVVHRHRDDAARRVQLDGGHVPLV